MNPLDESTWTPDYKAGYEAAVAECSKLGWKTPQAEPVAPTEPQRVTEERLRFWKHEAELWRDRFEDAQATPQVPAGYALVPASRALLEACLEADAAEELDARIDGSLLDAVSNALDALDGAPQVAAPAVPTDPMTEGTIVPAPNPLQTFSAAAPSGELPPQWRRLYVAVNDLMAHMGLHGSASARGDYASAVMDALHAIDGGTFTQRSTVNVAAQDDTGANGEPVYRPKGAAPSGELPPLPEPVYRQAMLEWRKPGEADVRQCPAYSADQMLSYGKACRAHTPSDAVRFLEKYGLGPMRKPSCLVCGQLPEKVAITHGDLPGIVVCEKCRDASVNVAAQEPEASARSSGSTQTDGLSQAPAAAAPSGEPKT